MRRAIRVLLSVIVVVAVAFGGIYLAKFMNASPFAQGEAGNEIEPVEKINGKDRVNVLIMGLDGGGTRSDVMMLASFDESRGQITVMSIPRDTKVKVGSINSKINAAYGHQKTVEEDGKKVLKMGKEETAIQAVKQIVPIPINYYIAFTFEDFRTVIDMLGGVEFDVRPQGYKYDDPAQDLYINIPGGHQVLDGKNAEGLVRYRHDYAMADLDRVKVQQDFLKELVRQKLNSKYIKMIPKIYDAINETVRSNITVKDAMKYGGKLLKMDPENVHAFTMPNYLQNGYVMPDKTKLTELLRTEFGYTDISLSK